MGIMPSAGLQRNEGKGWRGGDGTVSSMVSTLKYRRGRGISSKSGGMRGREKARGVPYWRAGVIYTTER